MHSNDDFLTNEDTSVDGYQGYLSFEEWLQLDTILNQKQVHVIGASVRRYEPRLDSQGRVLPGELFVMEQNGLCRLSVATREAELARMSEEEKRKYISWVRGQGKRRRGARHHKRKEATKRRRLERNWSANPFGCILHRSPYACKRIDRELWDEYVAPLWSKYDPKNLTVEFPRLAGTKVNPWTVYNMTVKNCGVVVYNGEDQLLFDLSKPAGDPRGANV